MHAFQRSVERCTEPIDLDDAVEQIQLNTDRARFLHRESISRTHWLVRQSGRWYRVVYNTRIKMIATVLGEAAATAG